MRLAVVQWSGRVGGAEAFNLALAAALRKLDVDTTIVFITEPGLLGERPRTAAIPFQSLGFGRGRDVLIRPNVFAAAVTKAGPDGALLPECGYIGAALRVGGYRGPVIATEHGAGLLMVSPGPRRLVRHASRIVGAWADDAEVGVSDFVLKRMGNRRHAPRIVRIYNGVDPTAFAARNDRPIAPGSVVIGFAGGLKPGKGADRLINAFAEVRSRLSATLLVAGDGPERGRLMALAKALGVQEDVNFLGWVQDMPRFWGRCDVAVFPSDGPRETFGMAALEAMACGKPVIASCIGALPEVVAEGVTGRLVMPGDSSALALALIAYARDSELRRIHGFAARARAIERFHIDDCARAYRDLFLAVTGSRKLGGCPSRLATL